MTFVLDCSHYQGTINWPAVAAAGCAGAYVKTTDGATGVDATWQANHAGAAAAGIPAGPYHFAEGGSVTAEAGNFASVWSAGWQLHPVLDYELSTANAGWLSGFRSALRAITGYQPFRVYSSYALLTGALNPSAWLDDETSIWIARYNTTLGWTNSAAVLWQNTDAATVPGIVGNVDEDQYLNGWTPGADMTEPDPNLDGFLYAGGPSCDAATPQNLGTASGPTGVSATATFGRVVMSQGMLQVLSDPNTGVLAVLAELTAAVAKLQQSAPGPVTYTASGDVTLTPES